MGLSDKGRFIAKSVSENLATTLLNDESSYGDVTTRTAVRMIKLSDWLAAGRRPTQRGRRTRIFHLLGRRLRDIVLRHAAVRSLERKELRDCCSAAAAAVVSNKLPLTMTRRCVN